MTEDDSRTIYTDSWHYRYVASVWSYKPMSICGYFWKLVGTILLMTAGTILVVSTAIGGVFIALYPVWQIFFDVHDQAGIASLSFVVWIFIGAITLIEYRKYLVHSGKLTSRRSKRPPGIVSQFIHAKYRKLCPIIKYRERKE